MNRTEQQVRSEWSTKMLYWANLSSQCPRCNYMTSDISRHVCVLPTLPVGGDSVNILDSQENDNLPSE